MESLLLSIFAIGEEFFILQKDELVRNLQLHPTSQTLIQSTKMLRPFWAQTVTTGDFPRWKRTFSSRLFQTFSSHEICSVRVKPENIHAAEV